MCTVATGSQPDHDSGPFEAGTPHDRTYTSTYHFPHYSVDSVQQLTLPTRTLPPPPEERVRPHKAAMPVTDDVLTAWFHELSIADDGGADDSGYTSFCADLRRLFAMLNHDAMREFALQEPKRLWKAVVDNATRNHEIEIANATRNHEIATKNYEIEITNAAKNYEIEIARLRERVASLTKEAERLQKAATEKIPAEDTPHFMAPAVWQALRGAPTAGDKLASVFQTHDHRYLDNYAPDLAICHKGSLVEEPGSIVCVVEFKPTSTERFDSHMLGQAWDYLHSTVKAQPHRRNVVAVLSSLKKNVVLMHDSQTQVTTLYRECTFADLDRYIRGVVLVQPGYGPPPSPWSADIGAPMQRLGKPRRTAVAAFKIPDAMRDDLAAGANAPVSDFCKGQKSKGRRRTQERFVNRSNRATSIPEVMAVKRLVQNAYPLVLAPRGRSLNPVTDSTTGVSDEINMLLKIDKLGAPTTLPVILYHTADFQELGTIPVEKPVSHDLKASAVRQVLHDVLDALVWLHSHKIVHRDVRWDNIVCVENAGSDDGPRAIKGILIDLGEAVDISDRLRAHCFRGGYTCCPLRLMHGTLETEGAYHPVPADDYAAWLLLVNSFMYPKPWMTALRASGKVLSKDSTKQKKMVKFWEELMVMDGWDRFYQAAVDESVDELRRLTGFVHWV
ncbi:hypothetical protein FN846DRAFT_887363 [Sphaerosporella brunnea]|uniref:Protein kinase domain-containing protein n=1 Tax=Sphaerosporella brunnea TaxID=1250544 RepID=A0A5J5F6Q0_9PEZI|nr:hypothetical protein FN846DRAFT_887363 [Sphaerosporella brunnea]